MNAILKQFEQMRVVPVVAIPDAGDAAPLAEALVQGGLPCAEITFRTEAALASMEAMAKRGDILVGAGTPLTVDQAKAAVDAGARFIVSPGFNPTVVRYCVDNEIPIPPGVSTPHRYRGGPLLRRGGGQVLPCGSLQGSKTLKAMSGPYTRVRFIPTGEISPQNLKSYLEFPKVLACGGTWIAKTDLISEGRFDAIVENAGEAVRLVKEAVGK
jgi:2-dehydro-3-deoxyphosphogluconate aldolase/(4S)-4-hydroxy-2-oxoglutarate aldolase